MLSKQKILVAVVGLAMMALPATALAGHHDHYRNGHQVRPYRHDNGKHKGWWKHGHDWGNRSNWNANPRNYHHEPDADDYRPAWNYHRRPDGYRGYSGSYYGTMPNRLNVGQQIQFLMQRRTKTYALYHQAKVRNDEGAQSRLSASIHNLDARIRRLKRTNSYGYVPMAAPHAYNPGSAPYYAGSPYMGNPYLSNNPTVNTLGAFVGPMLGMRY